MKIKFDDCQGLIFLVPTVVIDRAERGLAFVWLAWQVSLQFK